MRLPQALALCAVAILGLMLINDDSESAPPAPVAVVPSQPQGDPVSAPSDAPPPRNWLENVHTVKAGSGTGTAVSVRPDTLYTANHVVDGYSTAWIAVNRQWVQATVKPLANVGPLRDGALLTIAKGDLPSLQVREPEYDEPVTVFGMRTQRKMKGRVVRVDLVSLNKDEPGVDAGDSGGPIVGDDGCLIGIIKGHANKDDQINAKVDRRVVYFVPAEIFPKDAPNAVAKAQPSNSPAPQNCPGGVCPQPQAMQQQPQFYQFQQRGVIRYRIGN
jgi:hypothetical protein